MVGGILRSSQQKPNQKLNETLLLLCPQNKAHGNFNTLSSLSPAAPCPIDPCTSYYDLYKLCAIILPPELYYEPLVLVITNLRHIHL